AVVKKIRLDYLTDAAVADDGTAPWRAFQCRDVHAPFLKVERVAARSGAHIQCAAIAECQGYVFQFGKIFRLPEKHVNRHLFAFTVAGIEHHRVGGGSVVMVAKGLTEYIRCHGMWRICLARAMVSASPVCLPGSSESLITGVHSASSGYASVILMTIFIGNNPTSFVKLVPIPNDMPIRPRQCSTMRVTLS